MLNKDRLVLIVDLVRTKEHVTIDELCSTLYASPSTIRRDLKELETQGYLRRTHGGAVLPPKKLDSLPFDLRIQSGVEVKEKIASKAAEEINDGDCIFLDSSTTVSKIIPHLKQFSDLIIVTNGLYALAELEKLHKFCIFCTGGMLQENARSYVGAHALNMVERFHFDKLFFSTEGIVLESGAFDSNINHVNLWTTVIEHSKKRILLADRKKFERHPPYKVCDVSGLDRIITDLAPSKVTENLERFVFV